jgi:hypothetical protein
MKLAKNKIRTAGYFIKRLRDNGFIVLKMFFRYGKHDPRRWTLLVDPSGASVFITCYENKDFMDEIMFEFNDGGVKFPKNYSIKTDSLEVIIQHLITNGVCNNYPNSLYLKKPLNIINEKEER